MGRAKKIGMLIVFALPGSKRRVIDRSEVTHIAEADPLTNFEDTGHCRAAPNAGQQWNTPYLVVKDADLNERSVNAIFRFTQH
jgi:hypothetical protein